MRPARVFLVDDHLVALRLLSDALEGSPMVSVVGTAPSYAGGRDGILAIRPEVAVVDESLPDGDGLDLCRFLHEEARDVASILYAVADRPGLRDRAHRAGASAVLLKSVDISDLLEAILSLAGRPSRR